MFVVSEASGNETNGNMLIPLQNAASPNANTLLKPKRHSLRCHGFMVHALLLHMHTNVVDFTVMRRLCRREWNWQWNWQSVNQHSWDPWQRTTWSWRVTSDFNSVQGVTFGASPVNPPYICIRVISPWEWQMVTIVSAPQTPLSWMLVFKVYLYPQKIFVLMCERDSV